MAKLRNEELQWLKFSLSFIVIQKHWLEYKRMVKGLRNEPEKFGSSIEAVRQLEKVLLDLEKTVMTGNMIQSVLGMKVEVNKALVEEMTMFVRIVRSLFFRRSIFPSPARKHLSPQRQTLLTEKANKLRLSA